MRKLFVIAFVLVCLLFQAGCSKQASDEIDFGTIENSVYKNDYFGFSVVIPPEWSVQDQEMRKKIMDVGSKMVAGDDKNLNAVLKASEMQVVNLFTAFKYEIGSPVDYNSSIACVAEQIHHMPGIKRGKDYHFHTKKLLESGKMAVSFPKEIYTTKIDGVDFDVMTIEMSIANQTVKQKQYVTVMKRYALIFVISFISNEEEVELESVLASIKFQQ